MPVTVSTIQAMPGLGSADATDTQWWIDEADARLDAAYWPDAATADRATALWVAHMLTAQTELGMGSSGSVTSKSVGDVRVSFDAGGAGDGSGDDSDFKSTRWGRLYRRMVRREMGNVTLAT